MLVTELSRWGRSTTDLLATLKELEVRRVSVIALNGMAFDLATPHGRMIATVLAGIAEFERELIQERIRLASPRRRHAGSGSAVNLDSDRSRTGWHRRCSPSSQRRSYRLIGREVGLSKNTVADIIKRHRAKATRLPDRYFASGDTNVWSGPSMPANCASAISGRNAARTVLRAAIA